MENLELCKLIIGSAGLLGIGIGIIILVFRTGKIVQRIEDMEKKFDRLETKMDYGFKEIDMRFRKLEETVLPTINITLTKLEVRLDERTFRTTEHHKKEITE